MSKEYDNYIKEHKDAVMKAIRGFWITMMMCLK